MSIAWNHTWAAGDLLLDHVTLSTWHHAFRQRFGNPGNRAGEDYGTVSAGSDASAAAFYSHMQFGSGDTSLIFVGFAFTAFVPYADYTGTDPLVNPPALNWTYILANALGGLGNPRDYPKEFDDMSATAYRDAAAFVNGDNAKNLSDGLIYTRTAGNWVRAVAGVFADTARKYGKSTAGDYLNLLKPINDVINLVIAFSQLGTWDRDGTSNNQYQGDTTGGAKTTWALAKTSASADYAAPNPATIDNAPLAYCYGISTPDGMGGFVYTTHFLRAKYKAFATDDSSGYTPDIDVYSDGLGSASFGGADTSAGGAVFDANGDSVADGVMTKFETLHGLGTGGTLKTGFFGGLAQPNFCPEPAATPITGETRYQGYAIGSDPIMIFNYAVAGGFDERP